MLYYACLVLILVKNGCHSYHASGHTISSVTSIKNGVKSTIVLQPADSNTNLQSIKRSRISPKPWNHSIISYVKATFLPSGFPDRTPPRYLSYATYSWLQDLSTQLRGVLAAQRLLEGVGVGREGATALSALLAYLVRDGFGMLATLLFTSISSTKSPFRYDIKRWRLFADLINDIGITLEVMTTLFPREFFLPMICVGNMCKAMCGVAAGACGGSINLYWSKGSDISDINAKFGAQNTVTGSLGLLFAALFARSISSTAPTIIWSLYALLTALHIYANVKCMRLIEFDYLNTVRANIVIENFLASRQDGAITMTPRQVARLEPLLFLGRQGRNTVSKFPIRIGVSFDTLHQHLINDSSLQAQLQVSKKPYAIALANVGRCPTILVCLFSQATTRDSLEAYFHATLFGDSLNRLGVPRTAVTSDMHGRVTSAMMDANLECEKAWPAFVSDAECHGWDLNRSDLQTEGYTVDIN